eukprot:jgi/Undpi1/7804/HiC_scaffold_23.g10277.m1
MVARSASADTDVRSEHQQKHQRPNHREAARATAGATAGEAAEEQRSNMAGLARWPNQSSQERRLLYVEMLKRTSAAVSSGVQLVPPDTLRAIVQTFESSLNAAARISLGEGAVVGNPQAVRQPAARSQGSRQRSSIESGGALLRGRAQGH